MKFILACCCYTLAGLSVLLGLAMLIAGRLLLSVEAILLGVFLFFPVGYFFDLQSRHEATDSNGVSESSDAAVEAGD